MPIQDSAGLAFYTEDKSQRAPQTGGFRSAGVIEADRGLCGVPVFIPNESAFLKAFGAPSLERHGQATLEAYMLAKREVPQVLVRAKDPLITATDTPFGALSLRVEDGAVVATARASANMAAPVEENETIVYFNGEGDYCSKVKDNVVIRISEPTNKSAYAATGRPFKVQVFYFAGANHIDEDTIAELAFNPTIESAIAATGHLKLDGFVVGQNLGDSGNPVVVTTYVNGRIGTASFDYAELFEDGNDWGLFDRITAAVKAAAYSDGTPVVKPEWSNPCDYVPYGLDGDSSGSDVSDAYGYYIMDSRVGPSRQQLNCFNLSVAVSIEATVPIAEENVPGRKTLAPGFYSFPCGTVTVSRSGDAFVARFNLNTNLYLRNRSSYMFMGDQNEYWASFYNSYCVDSFDNVSLSYEDFDANYVSMQADSVLSGNYLLAKTSDTVPETPVSYTINYATDPLTNTLHYFSDPIKTNVISAANKSYAYSTALSRLLTDNLDKWRCIATPNLGDVMVPSDFNAAISSANESTLGLSNIGRSASLDVFGNGNLNGRHGNRFVADYFQYGYVSLQGRRMAITMAALVTETLRTNYKNGLEARPPFGTTYGVINCLGVTQEELTGPAREVLSHTYKLNPVIKKDNYVTWEEVTSQETNTSLSDIHSILSLILLKYQIKDAMDGFVAEYNDEDTVGRGMNLLSTINQRAIDKKYIQEGIVSSDHNVLGDVVLRFDYAIRMKGVARYVDIFITLHSQTQALTIDFGGL